MSDRTSKITERPILGVLVLILSSIFYQNAACATYLQIPGVVHIHTTFSSGAHDMAEIVEMAKEVGVEALVFTDHDRVVMEYGVFPLRKIVRKRVEHPSVLQRGVENYLGAIEDLNRAQDDVVAIPGVQSSPFYYWTGNPFKEGLTAHDYRKEILVVGMTDPADYEKLPVLHNGLAWDFSRARSPAFLSALALFVFGAWMVLRGRRKKTWTVLAVAALLAMLECHPFSASGFDPYHGDMGTAPYEEFIEFVRQRGALTFWSHPESSYSAQGRKMGPITLVTPPYSEDLIRVPEYTGFAALYGDSTTAEAPGMQWDVALTQFRFGERKKPVWTIAEADFHGQSQSDPLDRYLTVFLAEEKSQAAILKAMAEGRMYSVMKQGDARPVLEDFHLADASASGSAISGQTLEYRSFPEIRGKLSVSDSARHKVQLKVVKNGKVFRELEGDTPFEFGVFDDNPSYDTNFYRLEARIDKIGRILSNPVFAVRKATN